MAAKGLMQTALPIIGLGEVLGIITASSKARSRHRRGPSVKDGNPTGNEEKGDEKGGEKEAKANPVVERTKVAAQRILRNLLLFGGVELISRVKQRSFMWILTCTALVQHRVRAFSWNLALYFAIRAIFGYFRKIKVVQYLLHPVAIFLLHCVHNNLMIHHAETIDPSYISLWIQTLPQYNTLQDYLNHFSSKVIAEDNLETYQESQCDWDRLQRIPANMWTSFQKQFPMVVLLYTLPKLIFYKKTVKTFKLRDEFTYGIMRMARETFVRVLRTSAVLCVLPYCLVEFPCIISCLKDYKRRGYKRPEATDAIYCSERMPYWHCLFTSVLSTPVFLAEPEGRLEVMVVYTYWRIIEAAVRRYYLEHEEYISPVFTGLTAAVSSL